MGAPHERIALPRDLLGTARANSAGLDLNEDRQLATRAAALRAGHAWRAAPATGEASAGIEVRNPADHRDLVGHVVEATTAQVDAALYLRRLLARPPAATGLDGHASEAAWLWADWLRQAGGVDKGSACEASGIANGGEAAAAADCAADSARTPVGVERELASPVGERNLHATEARGAVLCVAAGRDGLLRQVGAALATGNRAVIAAGALQGLPPLPAALSGWLHEASDPQREAVDAALFSGTAEDLLALGQAIAERPGPIVAIHTARPDGSYPLERLVRERCISTNTTAAGGNAHLTAIG